MILKKAKTIYMQPLDNNDIWNKISPGIKNSGKLIKTKVGGIFSFVGEKFSSITKTLEKTPIIGK